MHFHCSAMREEAGELSHDELCSYQGGKPFGLASDFLLRRLIRCEWEIKKFPHRNPGSAPQTLKAMQAWGHREKQTTKKAVPIFCPMHLGVQNTRQDSQFSPREKGHPISRAISTKLWWNFSLPCKNSHSPGTDLLFTLSLWLDPHEANEILTQSEDLSACSPSLSFCLSVSLSHQSSISLSNKWDS